MTGRIRSLPISRLHPDVVEALRLLDDLPAGIAHGAWRDPETGKLGVDLTTDDVKRGLVEGEFSPEEIRRHVALMQWALGGAS